MIMEQINTIEKEVIEVKPGTSLTDVVGKILIIDGRREYVNSRVDGELLVIFRKGDDGGYEIAVRRTKDYDKSVGRFTKPPEINYPKIALPFVESCRRLGL